MTTLKTLTSDEVGILLTSAVHAPSMHNTQPWRFEIDGPVVDIVLDADRALPASDPAGRQVRIGLGAAAFNVRVAAAMLGHQTRVAYTPDPARPEIAVRLFLSGRQVPVPDLGSLYGELRRRHTYRGPMLPTPVAEKVRELLDQAARTESARLHWLDSAGRAELGRILRTADAQELHHEDRLHERARWIGGERERDGVPDSSLGQLSTRPAVVRNLSAGFDSSDRESAVFEKNPVIAVLSTDVEDDDAWLQAGMALQRVLLKATSYDLAASFLNQALEYPLQRHLVQELIGRSAWPQMILRIGYPSQATDPPPRRDWYETLDHWR